MATRAQVRDAIERLLGGEWRAENLTGSVLEDMRNQKVHWFPKGEWISHCRGVSKKQSYECHTTRRPCITCADYVDEFLPEDDKRLVPAAFGLHDRDRYVDTDG